MNHLHFLKADFHTHPLGDRYYPRTIKKLSSEDENNIILFLQKMANRNVDVLACTDHNTLVSGLWARELAKQEGLPLVVIPGSEVSVKGSTQQVHLLALNIQRDLPAGQLPLREAAREIRRQGGVAVMAHPVKYPQELSLNPDIFLELDGIEANNASEGIFPVERYLDKNSCYCDRFIMSTTGSDLHWEASVQAQTNRPHPFFKAPVQWLLNKNLITDEDLNNINNRR